MDRFRWPTVAMLWFVVLFQYADRQLISGVAPLVQREFALTKTQLGAVIAAFALTYGLFSPFAGYVVDRLRRRSLVLGGLHFWSAVCVATGFVRGYPSLLAARQAHGVTASPYFPAAVSMISASHDRSRSRALGVHQTGVYFGTIVGITGAALIGGRWGWRAAFIAFGTAGILLGFVLHFLLREPPAAEQQQRSKSLIRVMVSMVKQPTSCCLLLAFVCANGVGNVLLGWLPYHVFEKFGKSIGESALIASVSAQLGSLAGALLGGWSADMARVRTVGGRIIVQICGLMVAIPFVVMSGVGRALPIVVAAFIGWGMFKSVYEANIFASMLEIMPANVRGSVVGTMNMAAWVLGAFPLPIAVGWIADRSSLSLAIAFTATIYAVAVILLLIALPFNRRQIESPATTD